MTCLVNSTMALILQRDLQRRQYRDVLWHIFFSADSDAQMLVERVHRAFADIDIPDRMRAVLTKTVETNDKFARIAMILFGLWLAPEIQEELMRDQKVNPRYFVPFVDTLQDECIKMLHGKYVTVQAFVIECMCNYIMTPPKRGS